MARRNEGASPQRAVIEEQRSQTAVCAKTPRAAVLLAAAGVGSALTARCGDAPTSPPWPQPKSLAAGPLGVFKLALRRRVQGIHPNKLRKNLRKRNDGTLDSLDFAIVVSHWKSINDFFGAWLGEHSEVASQSTVWVILLF
jgi:hypothetical protein